MSYRLMAQCRARSHISVANGITAILMNVFCSDSTIILHVLSNPDRSSGHSPPPTSVPVEQVGPATLSRWQSAQENERL